MRKTFTKNVIKFSIITLTTFLSLNSCGKDIKANLKDFDQSQLKERYTFDINYTIEKNEEQQEVDSSSSGFDKLTMLGLLSINANVLFYEIDSKLSGTLYSRNKFNSNTKSKDLFSLKIENDSIIYIKVIDTDITNKHEYVKSAVLKEYGKDYSYFIIKPLSGVYRNFEFKAVEEK